MTDWAKDDLMDPLADEEAMASRRGRGSRLLRHLIALALVLVAIGGLAYVVWYGYQTWRARGSEGLAPVIRADAGPTRVRPEQPGGLVIPHQDRLILNDLDGGGVSVTAERLLPAPEEPMPRPEPAVAEAPGRTAAEPVRTAAVVTPPEEARPLESTPAEPAAAVVPPPAVERMAEDKVPAAATTAPAEPSATQVAQAEESLPELVTTPAVDAAPPPAAEVVSVAALLRSHRVQLAAVDSEESARRAWLRYQGLYQDLLGDLSLLVQQVKVNNRTYFRVQGGPLEAAGARRICQAIKARGADCLVVRP